MRKLFQTFASAFLMILLSLSTSAIAPAYVSRDNFPRLDEMTMVICESEADLVTRAQGGAIDVAKDLESPDNVELLQDLGWKISTNVNYECGYVEINCRSVTTPESGMWFDYHGRQPGDAVFFPLNVSEFRYALSLLRGGEVTDTALLEIFGWTKLRIDAVVSPAYGQWFNSELSPVPYDPAQAMDLLYSIGIRNDTGPLGWYNTNADIGPLGELRTIYVLGCPEAIESTTAMSYRYQASWNNFFGKKSDTTSNYFDFDLLPEVIMEDIVWRQRDFDICALEFPLVGKGMTWPINGRDPDWLFDCFHSSKDGPDNYNLAGIAYPELDEMLFAIKYWRWPDGTYITTVEELVNIAWLAQEYLYYLTPCIPMYYKTCVNAFAPGLKCWIDSPGYGSDNWWTYNWLMWENPTWNSVNIGVPGPVGTLNPGKANSANEWEILGRVYDSLLAVDPFLHKDVMWAMSGYEIDPWSELGVVEYGQKVTVHLRHGVYWHDGDLVTSADVKFNYDFIMNAGFNRYSDILLTYHNTTIIDDYNFEIYMKCTGIWTVYTYLGSALLFPEVIWSPWWDNPGGAYLWDPWTVDYDDWMYTNYGWVNDTGYLKCIIGTGPWIFHEWDMPAGAIHLVANRPGAVWAGNPGYFAQNFLREDMNFDGIVDIFDAIILAESYMTYPGHPRWNYGIADLDCDGIVDVYDLRIFRLHGGYVTLPFL